MKTLRNLLLATLALAVLAAPLPAAATSGVGLGVSVGANFPKGAIRGTETKWSDASFGWGFWVDIPIVWKFNITPSAELFKVGGVNVTDVDLNFKFIIPIAFIRLFAGPSIGVTNAEAYHFNAGVLAGISFRIFGPLELFAMGAYRIIIGDDKPETTEIEGNVHNIHLNAGALFVF
jgi:hypothetical protein